MLVSFCLTIYEAALLTSPARPLGYIFEVVERAALERIGELVQEGSIVALAAGFAALL
jgi:hypothetical protein